MAAWADLPAEIAITILQEVSRRPCYPHLILPYILEAQKHTRSCVRVSRQFRGITEPLLYHEIYIPAPKRDGSHALLNLSRFVRAIVQKPALGRHVRMLSVPLNSGGVDSTGSYRAQTVIECSTTKNHFNISSNLARGNEPTRDNLQAILIALPDLFPDGSVIGEGPSGILLTLLHLLPKLQKLEIRAIDHMQFIANSCSVGPGESVPAALRSITELSVSSQAQVGGFSKSEIFPLMSLPSLQKLDVYRFSDDVYFPTKSTLFPPRPLLPKSSSVTTLIFFDSVVSCDVVSEILTLPTRLKHFYYYLGNEEVGTEPFHPSRFFPGLLAQASSLTELSLSPEMCGGSENPAKVMIGSLKEMVVMEKLTIPIRLLLHFSHEEDDADGDYESGIQDSRGYSSRAHRGDLESTSVSRNPLDTLLPPKLVSLSLQTEAIAFDKFLLRTGLPQSLRFTREELPSLRRLRVEGRNESLKNKLMALDTVSKLRKLYPGMAISFTVEEYPPQMITD
ncbi:hypothetical protein DL93DRAFT_1684108 [Clavulina sp. PMI_390]|nr:hypothetical protein DL93DRAFT_1684108 [Clavulina sp. PMI_390]